MGLLVTGGRGFIGSHFVWAAAREGRRVVVLDDHSGGAPAPMPHGVLAILGDIGDERLVSSLIREHRLTALVHFAGKIQVGESVQRPELYFDVNVSRSLRLLESARRGGLEQIVFSSTAAVYGHPDRIPIGEDAPRAPVNPYGATKLAFEFALEAAGRAHGLRWVAPRYFNAAGASPDGHLREAHEPETHLIPLILDAALGRRPPLRVYGADYPTPDGSCIRDYIHVCDLADAHLAALRRLEAGDSLGPINLGLGRGYSVLEVLAAAKELVGMEVPYDIGPRRPGDPPVLVADPARAQVELGFNPCRSELRTILEDTLRSRR